jgi:hypothetical protein
MNAHADPNANANASASASARCNWPNCFFSWAVISGSISDGFVLERSVAQVTLLSAVGSSITAAIRFIAHRAHL